MVVGIAGKYTHLFHKRSIQEPELPFMKSIVPPQNTRREHRRRNKQISPSTTTDKRSVGTNKDPGHGHSKVGIGEPCTGILARRGRREVTEAPRDRADTLTQKIDHGNTKCSTLINGCEKGPYIPTRKKTDARV